MLLTKELQEFKAVVMQNFSPELGEKLQKVAAEFDQQGLGDKALRVGEKLPDATLTDQNGRPVTLSELLYNGPMIITFYRGGWCPFCNLELRAYQNLLDEIKTSGGQLVAITSEKPDNSLSTIEKNDLAFPVLTDTGNVFAKALGISYDFPEELKAIYKNDFNMDLAEINGETAWSLAIPATYVVNKNGDIVTASVERDYTTRYEPAEALAALREIA